VVVVAAVVVIVLLLGGTDAVPGLGPDRPPTPDFAFETVKVSAVPTVAGAPASDLDAKATTAAHEIQPRMDELYIGAFLDPGNWQEGSFDDVWGLFEEGAGAEAQAKVDTLTAGIGAGDAFDTILPNVGKLKTKVLFDQHERPYSVVAIVRFEATGTGKGGGDDLVMKSQGQFVFQKLDGDWKVVSFRVLRNDEQEAPSPSASASATVAGSS
jgi:hypothetical protein